MCYKDLGNVLFLCTYLCDCSFLDLQRIQLHKHIQLHVYVYFHICVYLQSLYLANPIAFYDDWQNRVLTVACVYTNNS